jgi:hypothetical protein
LKEWEEERVGDMRLYFAENLLLKVIWYADRFCFGYKELDVFAPTEKRQRLLAKTARGKSKPLNQTNLFTLQPVGYTFHCVLGWKAKLLPLRGVFVTHHVTGEHVIAGAGENIHSYTALANWVKMYTSSRAERKES